VAIDRIAFTMYPVSDMQRAVAFYSDVLGLKQEGPASEFWTEFDLDGGTFGVGAFEQVGKPGSAQSLALEVDDLPAFRAALAKRGVDASEPHELTTCFVSAVSDPDGNQIWLHQSKPR
ncbi:MAG: glyoxalase, partial [Candidatus Eremiobacteraeota bacterium]|jgi:predicted enzyme related to lactoylglutathione lyase|nr:glyoxalase [Candidatus Eremiobacteraeota bacterium]